MNLDALDYGALGLLFLVLGAVGLFLRNWMKGEQEERAKRDERRAERERADREERQNLAATLTSLGEASAASNVKLSVALEDLCREVRSSQVATMEALAALVEGQREHERRANERHRQQMERCDQQLEQGREITRSLKALNGKS